MVRSLWRCVLPFMLSFGATALRPSEMDANDHQLKPESLAEVAEKANASSLSELQPVNGPNLVAAMNEWFFTMTTTIEMALNPNDPPNMPCAFFHNAARQALKRAFDALVSMEPTGNSLLRMIQQETADPETVELSDSEVKVLKAVKAMMDRLDFIHDLTYLPTQNLQHALTTTHILQETRVKTAITHIQKSLEGYVKLFQVGKPRDMDQDFAVPIYMIWKYRDAWTTLVDKLKKNKIQYYSSTEYTLDGDLSYICIDITETVSRERTEDGQLPEPKIAYFPPPFVVFAKFALQQVWGTAGLGVFPEASFAVTGTTGPENWDHSEDGPWEKGEAGYHFKVLLGGDFGY